MKYKIKKLCQLQEIIMNMQNINVTINFNLYLWIKYLNELKLKYTVKQNYVVIIKYSRIIFNIK